MNMKKPILVIGATGKVGQQVTRQLLEKNIPTRAFVRNATKAEQLFGSNNGRDKNLELVVGDVTDYEKMEEAVKGCQAAISVSGTLRFSQLSDFLPWRLFNFDVSSWCQDKSHPYYTNYLPQVHLAELACKYELSSGVVRLTGLSTGYSPFNIVSILFSTLLSLTSRYHYAAERDMFRTLDNHRGENAIPLTILRPGGLSDEPRNKETTALQVDASGQLPPPGRVGRADVAALAIRAVICPTSTSSSKNVRKSRALAIRWCGEGVKPKAQGKKEDGCSDADGCFELVDSQPVQFDFAYPDKNYALGTSLLVYPLIGLSLKLVVVIITWVASKFL